jgi:hypothetical protein
VVDAGTDNGFYGAVTGAALYSAGNWQDLLGVGFNCQRDNKGATRPAPRC